MTGQKLRFTQLPVDLVRVDWIGEVITSMKFGKAQRMVRVAISLWVKGRGWSKARRDLEQPRIVELPVAFLDRFPVGSVWADGYHVTDEPMERHTFHALDVRPSEIVPAGRQKLWADRVSRYDLPFQKFDAHRDHTQSCVVVTQVDEATVLITPCMELVRFYFGSSGSLLNKMFSGAFALKELDCRVFKDPKTGVANLVLGSGLPGNCAQTLARIYLDDAARRAFNTVVKSGMLATNERRPWFPYMPFPLKDLTDLTADGVWIENGDRRVFVALRLISCSHPFPFTKLYYRLDKSAAAEGSSGVIKNARSKAYQDEIPISRAAQSRSLAPRVVEGSISSEERFPDLAGKQIRRTRAMASEVAGRRTAEPEARALAGGPTRSEGHRGVDFAQSPLTEPPIDEPPCLERLRRELAGTLPDLSLVRVGYDRPVPWGALENEKSETSDALHRRTSHLISLQSDRRPMPTHDVWLLISQSEDVAETSRMVLLVEPRELDLPSRWVEMLAARTNELLAGDSGRFVVAVSCAADHEDEVPAPMPMTRAVRFVLDPAEAIARDPLQSDKA